MKENEVLFNGNEPSALQELMAKYGKSQSPFYGINENGYPAGETFEGRWK